MRARQLASQLLDLRTLACALADALVLLDRNGGVRWCNPAAQWLTGIVWPRGRGLQASTHFGDGGIGVWLRTRRDQEMTLTIRQPCPRPDLGRQADRQKFFMAPKPV